MNPVTDEHLIDNIIFAAQKQPELQREDDRDSAIICAYLSGISQLVDLLVKYDGSDITVHRIGKLLPAVAVKLDIPFGLPPQ